MVSEVNVNTERHFLEESPRQPLPVFCWAPCGFSSTNNIGP